MEWNTDTNKCKHDTKYLVYYDGNYPSHSIQVYMKHEDKDTNFTGEGFYCMDRNFDYWNRCYKQPKYFRELDTPNLVK